MHLISGLSHKTMLSGTSFEISSFIPVQMQT